MPSPVKRPNFGQPIERSGEAARRAESRAGCGMWLAVLLVVVGVLAGLIAVIVIGLLPGAGSR